MGNCSQSHVAQRSYFTGISTNFLLGKNTLNINLCTQVSQKTTPELLEHTLKIFLFLIVLYRTSISSLTKTSCKSAAYSTVLKCYQCSSNHTPLSVNITFRLEALAAQTLPSCAAIQVALLGLGAHCRAWCHSAGLQHSLLLSAKWMLGRVSQ